MIDNKGKLFGKINVVDLLIVALLVIVAIATAYKFGISPKSDADNSNITIEYVLKVSGIRESNANNILAGDKIYEKKTQKLLGTVTNVERKPAMDHITAVDGTIKYVQRPQRYDVNITVESDGKIINGGYFANGTRGINIFGEIEISSQKYTMTTEVLSVCEKK